MSERLLKGLTSQLDHVIRNGDAHQSYPGLTSDCMIVMMMTSCPLYTAGCVNLSFAYVEGESLLMAMKDVALSSGRSVLPPLSHHSPSLLPSLLTSLPPPPPPLSACTSASLEPSYVLRAVGADEDLAHSSIRFGVGRFTTEEEVDYTVERCVTSVTQLRDMR